MISNMQCSLCFEEQEERLQVFQSKSGAKCIDPHLRKKTGRNGEKKRETREMVSRRKKGKKMRERRVREWKEEEKSGRSFNRQWDFQQEKDKLIIEYNRYELNKYNIKIY